MTAEQTGNTRFRYREFPPAAPLANHVLTYWRFEASVPPGETFTHHVWPDGCVSVNVVAAGGAAVAFSVTGPRLAPLEVPMVGDVVATGIRFWPDAGGAVLGTPAESLRDRWIDATELLGTEARTMAAMVAAEPDRAAMIFDDWVAARLRDARPLDPVVRTAVRAIIATRGDRSIASLARDSGLGIRQLQRRFRRALGLSPKEYSRIRRLRSTLEAALRGEASWSAVAYELGFADQSHLIHEVGDLTGLTPAAVRERLGLIEHVDVRA